MAYVWTDIDYALKEINPYYVPIEERAPEDQEIAHDRACDWGEEND